MCHFHLFWHFSFWFMFSSHWVTVCLPLPYFSLFLMSLPVGEQKHQKQQLSPPQLKSVCFPSGPFLIQSLFLYLILDHITDRRLSVSPAHTHIEHTHLLLIYYLASHSAFPPGRAFSLHFRPLSLLLLHPLTHLMMWCDEYVTLCHLHDMMTFMAISTGAYTMWTTETVDRMTLCHRLTTDRHPLLLLFLCLLAVHTLFSLSHLCTYIVCLYWTRGPVPPIDKILFCIYYYLHDNLQMYCKWCSIYWIYIIKNLLSNEMISYCF